MRREQQITGPSTGGHTADDLPESGIEGYSIDRKIGEGAMANLYLVRDSVGKQSVIKVPRWALTVDPVCMVAFENELRLAPYLADFSYACMPKVSNQDSARHLAMDYIEGVDLWSHLKEHGPLSEAETIALGMKIVFAVAQLHERRIVHLDLKLSNVMLTPSGEVRLIDFGLANHLDLPDLIYESFREPKGSPAYIAPEQFIGVRNETRSDLFSVGVMLFELATGELPFPNATTMLGVINRIKRTPVSPRVSRPELSPQFEIIVAKCLQANPDHRFADMDALYDALEAWQSDIELVSDTWPVSATANTGTGRISTWLRRTAANFNAMFNSSNNFNQLHSWRDNRSTKPDTSAYRILAAINLSSGDALNIEILRRAQQMAGLQHSYITVVNVTAVDVGMASGERNAQLINEQLVKARKKIATLIPRTGLTAAQVGINVLIGDDPVGVIHRCVNDYGIDLVVIGCPEKNRLRKFIHGSTGYKILTSVKRSVFVVHAPKQARILSDHLNIENVA
ncbi:MAG: hypothetical protein AMJ68_03980 [Acidithiobacillales bacterium SG8_45]|nr:MAG: hypothetical protein AMJ68_03980 [Acidithiobacillales bacterium SG8_45]